MANNYHIEQGKSSKRSFDWLKDNIESLSHMQGDFSDRDIAQLEEKRGFRGYLLPLFVLLLFFSLLLFSLPSHIAMTWGDPWLINFFSIWGVKGGPQGEGECEASP